MKPHLTFVAATILPLLAGFWQAVGQEKPLNPVPTPLQPERSQIKDKNKQPSNPSLPGRIKSQSLEALGESSLPKFAPANPEDIEKRQAEVSKTEKEYDIHVTEHRELMRKIERTKRDIQDGDISIKEGNIKIVEIDHEIKRKDAELREIYRKLISQQQQLKDMQERGTDPGPPDIIFYPNREEIR